MKPFDYIQAPSITDACIAAAEHSPAKFLAGGTDLLIELRRGNGNYPKSVVDISFLHELRGIEATPDGLIRIGPLTTHSELSSSALLRKNASFLSSAASTIGSPQIRNRGTVGGNVMNSAACADTVPPLIALGASVTLQSVEGRRTITLSDFFIGPYKNIARGDELLTSISFSPLPSVCRSSFVKLGRRNALSISRLSVAAVIGYDRDGRIADARIVPGSAFPVWRRVREAEQVLLGEEPSDTLFTAAGKRVSEAMVSYTGRRWSTEYKEAVITILVRRALEMCGRG